MNNIKVGDKKKKVGLELRAIGDSKVDIIIALREFLQTYDDGGDSAVHDNCNLITYVDECEVEIDYDFVLNPPSVFKDHDWENLIAYNYKRDNP